jgi:hypothetical protein
MVRFVLCLLLPSCLVGTELAPWFDPAYLPVWRNEYVFQAYPRIDTAEGKIATQGRNHLLHSSLSLARADEFAVEAELALSQSKIRSFSFESGKLTGRLHLLNDIVGDPVSMMVGISLAAPMRRALYDYNLLYHGLFECELHVSVGKETSCLAEWLTRWWAVAIAGLADRGSPWLRVRTAWERNFCTTRLELFVEGYGGFGHRDLRLSLPFRGYGSIAYRAIDLGVAFRYFTVCNGVFSLGYSFRPYAHNLPMYVQQALVGWRCDFSL